MTPRVRYAPSPTGEPHIGNIRTALFNWLFARHAGGAFILRIEDTDTARTVPGAETALLESLRWLGLDWDEGPEVGGPHGPYRQSERLGLYRKAAETLVADGAAYQCYCSPERLELMREEQRRQHLPPRYDRRCRDLSPAEASRLSAGCSGEPVVRFRTPDGGQTAFHDLIRGDVTFKNEVLDDFILLKSDGYPTYHLANVVDDHAMATTHVMRADEWLPSTPRHVLLYRALDYEPPLFAHLPMILGPDRAKLSKRHGATALLAYREAGYLPEAVLNFLALLGWALDDHTEIFSRDDLVRHFLLERVGKTPAIFNAEKLLWMNGLYLRALSTADLTDRLLLWLERPSASGGLPDRVPRPIDRAMLERITPLIQERIKLLREAVPLVDCFFQERLEPDLTLFVGRNAAPSYLVALRVLRAAVSAVEGVSAFDPPHLEERLRAIAQTAQEEGWAIKSGDLLGVIRIAVTGRKVSPPLFETMAILGQERCLDRLRDAINYLPALVSAEALADA